MTWIVRLGVAVGVWGAAVPCGVTAFGNLVDAYRWTDSVRLARAIDQSGATSPEPLLSAVRPEQLAAGSETCLDEPTKALISIRFGQLRVAEAPPAQTGPIDTARRAALAAVEHRLDCVPTDGNAWMLRAILINRLGAPRDVVSASILRSYVNAPAEDWVIWTRLPLTADLVRSGDVSVRSVLTSDLRKLVALGDVGRVAETYVAASPELRGLMLDALDVVPRARQETLKAAVDRLGVLIKSRSTCTDPPPRGAELTESLRNILSKVPEDGCPN